MRDRFDHTLERKLDTKPDSSVVVWPSLGVVTGPGRSREWPAAEKTRIIVESLSPGANVSEVARRNGLSPQQLFGWRREARELFVQDRSEARAATGAAQATSSTTHGVATPRTRVAAPTAAPPAFVPIVVATSGSVPQSNEADTAERLTSRNGATDAIEIVIGAFVVRVVGCVNADTLKAVVEIVRRLACS